MTDGISIDAYLARLASGEPTPGGGSAACVAAALGAALVAMVGRLTLASPKLVDRHARVKPLVDRADALRHACLAGARADEEAYAVVVAAQRLPRATDQERAARSARLQSALAEAAEVPLRNAATALELLRLTGEMAEAGTPHAQSDVRCAALFARAAMAAAIENVLVNHEYLKDETLVAAQRARIAALRRESAALG
ncbi:MAG TPA: cyclodeaminase/cyclohydrolase family protein [Candidatus Dormibacteraeota bacterium]|nr:cyclodeaminase/cyclohydrolase family protein [Candidatus Dormibacteraeota bacterium]